MRPAAVGLLAGLGEADALDAALEYATSRAPARGLLFRAFRDLPLDVTGSHVTEWLDVSDTYRRRAASAALGRHATRADLPVVRERLATEVGLGTRGEQYVVCNLASALGKYPDCGAFPELTAAYEAMPYSFGRRFVVDAMAVTDASFATRIGVGSLWDAESATRRTAAACADRTQAVAAARIAQLRSDSEEDPDVRAAAGWEGDRS